MEYKVNDFPITIGANGEVRYSYFLSAISNFSTNVNLLREVLKIDESFRRKERNGRRVEYYVKPEGILQYLQITTRLSKGEKDEILNVYKNFGFIDKKIVFQQTRMEKNFEDVLNVICNHYGLAYKKQVLIKEKYYIDFVVGDYAIEYDENNHDYYDKKQEKKREQCIINEGFTIIRINSKNNNTENILKLVDAFIRA